jgi:protein TonB
MNYSARQSQSPRKVAGLLFVVLFHVFIIHALSTGMARRMIDVVHRPVEAKVIEEVKLPPPPVEVVLPAPRLESVAPPPYIPPPEVQIALPATAQNTITAITTTAPPGPQAITPTARPFTLPTEPTAAIARAPVSAAVVCSNYASVMGDAAYPREAQRAGLDRGEALVQFTVAPSGLVKDIKVVHATNPIFARNSVRIVAEYRCQGQAQDVLVQVPFGYRLE